MVKLAATLAVTVRLTVVVSVVAPEVPVMVIGYVPAATVEPTTIDTAELPVPVIEAGLKLTVTPVGWPVADKAMAESKPPETVVVTTA